MSIINFSSDPQKVYPVFEPDQVLTNKHLNGAIAHLQQQDALTRTRLLGTGILSGLQASYDTTGDVQKIIISKGAGITGSGYLVNFEGGIYSATRTYTLPELTEAIDPEIRAAYRQLILLELVPLNAEIDGDQPLKESDLASADYVVMLLAEPKVVNLKNCTVDDCTDKGQEVNITYRPMLVKASALSQFNPLPVQQDTPLFPAIPIRKWNVPADSIQHPSALVTSFDAVLNAQLLADFNNAFTFVYHAFSHLYTVPGDDKLKTAGTTIGTMRDQARNGKPYYMQCVYAFAVDLIKAYEEFCAAITDLLPAPDAELPQFPLHLCLGRPVKGNANGNYRTQFQGTPLVRAGVHPFDEACLLYKRLVIMLNTFALPEAAKVLQITPSRTMDAPLGDQAIPYYYDGVQLFPYWDYRKYKTGRAKQNKGYYANRYQSIPAEYTTWVYEDFAANFYRVEGHLGMNITDAMKGINNLKVRNQYPFDVVAVNLYATSTYPTSSGLTAIFADLENQYQLLLTELLTRVAPLYNRLQSMTIDGATVQALIGAYNKNTPNGYVVPPYLGEPWNNTAARFIDNMRMMARYQRGSFLQYFFGAKFNDPNANGPLGGYYLRWVDHPDNASRIVPMPPAFKFTDEPGTWTKNHYHHAFYLIDILEELLRKIILSNVDELSLINFNEEIKKFTDALNTYADFYNAQLHAADILKDQTDAQADNLQLAEEREYWESVASKALPLVAECKSLAQLALDERMALLKREYEKRCTFILQQLIFTNFTRQHPGIRHGGGVAAGGTLVLVYFDRTDIAGAPDYPADTVNQLIQQRTVCADFYLPNIMVTSYAPLATVYESAPSAEVEPRISLDSHNYCSGQNIVYPITLWPVTAEGQVTGPGTSLEVKDGVQKWVFKPAAVAPGDYNITYTIGNRSAYFPISVKAPVSTDFTVVKQVTNAAKNGVEVLFQASDIRGVHSWIFGDGTSAAGTYVNHLFTLPAGGSKDFVVQHMVSDGSSCVGATTSKTITVKRDDVPLSLSVEDANPCTHLSQVRVFNSPAGGVVACSEPAALSLVSGVYYFNPATAGAGKPDNYEVTLTYTLNGRSVECKVKVRQSLSTAFNHTVTLKSSTGGGLPDSMQSQQLSGFKIGGGTTSPTYEYRVYEVAVQANSAGTHDWFLSTGDAKSGNTATLTFSGRFPVSGGSSETPIESIVADPVEVLIPVYLTHRVTNPANGCQSTRSVYLTSMMGSTSGGVLIEM
ncbi:hypothetical protein [Chitinophaga sp. CB10]|uniref:hypothetical protein n=1 Tax=Chitinophaga sp. CB10 TaxID=1891659 RepID=UPI0025C0AF56|nr:hypothetical protein [Chitinophaga sp. CB10]